MLVAGFTAASTGLAGVGGEGVGCGLLVGFGVGLGVGCGVVGAGDFGAGVGFGVVAVTAVLVAEVLAATLAAPTSF